MQCLPPGASSAPGQGCGITWSLGLESSTPGGVTWSSMLLDMEEGSSALADLTVGLG